MDCHPDSRQRMWKAGLRDVSVQSDRDLGNEHDQERRNGQERGHYHSHPVPYAGPHRGYLPVLGIDIDGLEQLHRGDIGVESGSGCPALSENPSPGSGHSAPVVIPGGGVFDGSVMGVGLHGILLLGPAFCRYS